MDLFLLFGFFMEVAVCYLLVRTIRILRAENDDLAGQIRHYEAMMPDYVVRQVKNKTNRRKQHETNTDY